VGFAFDPDGALIVATRSAPEASQVDVERIDLEGNGTQATPLDKGTPPSLASGQILVSSRESGYRLWDTYDLATLGAGDAVQDILGARQSSQLYLSAAFEVLGWHGDGLWIWDPAEARLVRRFDAGQLSGDGARVFLPRDGHIDVLDAISGAQVDEYRFDSGESTGFTDSAAETAVYSGTNLRVFESSVTVDYTTYLDIADVGDQGIVWRSTSDNLHAARGGRHFSPPPWSLSGGALHVQAADGKQLFWSLVGADDIEGATHLMAMSPLLTAPGAFDEGKAWLLLRMIGKELNLDRMRFGSVGELVDFTIDDTTRDRLQGLAFQGIIEARHFAALPTEWLKYLLREFGPNMSASVAEHMDLEKALSLSHWFEKRTPKTAIALAEAAIAAAPDDGRAYTRRGYARARAGDLEDAIADFEEAVTLAKGADANGSDDRRLAKALYDLACGLSLHAAALQTEAAKSAAAAQALDRLSEAVSAGYNDWGHIAEDRDLGEVRADPSFEARLSAWKSGSLSTPAEVKED
jgi:tetratricopeptide (TPR) repeat protein